MDSSTAGGSGDAESSPVEIRRLVNRKVLASYRYRAAVARRLGMRESEIAVLQQLGEGGLTPSELGRRLQLSSGGMTALLHRLRRRSQIGRRPHPTDRRSVIVTADAVVVEQIRELFAPLAAEVDAITEGLANPERRIVHEYLMLIVASSERHAERLIADADAAEILIDDDASHLWA